MNTWGQRLKSGRPDTTPMLSGKRVVRISSNITTITHYLLTLGHLMDVASFTPQKEKAEMIKNGFMNS